MDQYSNFKDLAAPCRYGRASQAEACATIFSTPIIVFKSGWLFAGGFVW